MYNTVQSAIAIPTLYFFIYLSDFINNSPLPHSLNTKAVKSKFVLNTVFPSTCAQ